MNDLENSVSAERIINRKSREYNWQFLMKILWDPIWENRKEWKEIWKEWPWNHRKSSIIFQNFCQNPSGLAIRSAPHQFQIFASENFYHFSPILKPWTELYKRIFAYTNSRNLYRLALSSTMRYDTLWMRYDLFAILIDIYQDKTQDLKTQDLKTSRPRKDQEDSRLYWILYLICMRGEFDPR